MSQFLELNEAAQRLGVTPDKLVEMRSAGEIRGFRDGASWKFKEDEVDRVKAELGDSGDALDDDPLSFDEHASSSLELADDESILVSEEELGHSGEATSSTIIGKATEATSADSDLALVSDAAGSDLDLASDGSDLSLVGGSGIAGGSGIGSELSLTEPTEGDSAVGSDVTLVPGVTGSGVSLVPDPGSDKDMDLGSSASDSGIGDVLADDSELSLESPSSGGTGNLELSADTGLGSGDLDMSLDSELALSDDDDMVLSGSGTGSDLSLGAGDSGINLTSPTDSGLSLEVDSGIQLDSPTDSGLSLEEEPLDLGGSSISSLELPEDEEIVDLGDVDEASGAVQKDEEFLLSPSDEMFMDESDSGSQVIALEDSAAFDQDAATLVPGQALLAETDGLDEQLDAFDGGAPATPMAAPAAAAAQTYAAEPPETPYSIWNVIGLMLIIMFLSLSGIVMTDMMKNMWAWDNTDGAHDVATAVSNGLTAAAGLKD
ncbi:MAG: helix-turn-helix domain-containing protein [Planctomycetes bacterium]|nr:helix-turn-helix domain-containing protein [Planctomycetota bacterium]